MQKLIFRARFNGLAGAFYDADDAARNDKIYSAIRRAETWGELRRLLPSGEFESLGLWMDMDGEHVYHDGKKCLFGGGMTIRESLETIDEEFILRPEDPFEAEQLPGFCDGDYPPFLEPEQGRFLPHEFCDKYGKYVSSFTSGSWWEFPLDRAVEMKEALESEGYEVEIE